MRFHRYYLEGSWREMCKGKDVIKITNDSFKCSYHRDDLTNEFTTVAPRSYVLDEKFKTLTFRYFNDEKKIYNCNIQ